MAVSVGGAEYTVTSAAVSLSTILAAVNPNISTLVILANPSNAGNIAIGGSNVTTAANRRVLLTPGDSFAVGLDGSFTRLVDWYLIGPGTAEVAHIVVLT
jgi:hypothetical protein